MCCAYLDILVEYTGYIFYIICLQHIDNKMGQFKLMRKNIKNSLNGEAIELAYSKKWINTWEYDFYVDTFR